MPATIAMLTSWAPTAISTAPTTTVNPIIRPVPILGQIRSVNLTHVLVVVVRYFGGIKLGVGGLIVAYRTAAAQALEAATVIERTETAILEIIFDYEHLNTVMGLAKELKLEIQQQDFNVACRLQVAVRKNLLETVIRKSVNLARVKILNSD